MRPVVQIDACRASHARLLGGLAALTDGDCRGASRLPGYTRARLISHLTNKARAHTSILRGPVAGQVRRLHPEGYDADAAAASGVERSTLQLVAELESALGELETAWDGLDDELWSAPGIMMAGSRTMVEIVGHHLRNIEVHHVDLDIGYTPAHWPDAFVEGELAKRMAGLAGRADHADLLAWLLDRAPAPDLSQW